MNKRLGKAAATVVTELHELDAQRARVARRAYKALERYDPITAKLAKRALGNKSKAAYWLAAPQLWGEVSFWDVIVFGDTNKVRSILKSAIK